MEITENQVYEAFGLGAKEQDIAAPAPDAPPAEVDAGAKEQDVAEPAHADAKPPADMPDDADGDAENEVDGETDPDVASGETDADDAKKTLTPEQRRENAALRRRQEQKSAVEEAVQQALATERERYTGEMASFFQKANLKNTITDAPITSMEEFYEWQKSFDAAKLQNDLKAGKLTPEGLQKVISEIPLMKQAEEIVRRDEIERQRQNMAVAQAKTDAELAEIRKLDPTIKGMDDILKMPTAGEFYEYIKKGNSFIDAYYLANREYLQLKTAESARQQAVSNARSKDHLTATTSRGSGAASVPPDEMALFRELMPNATEAEIRAFYNKSKS